MSSRNCPSCGSHYGDVLQAYPYEHFICKHCGKIDELFVGYTPKEGNQQFIKWQDEQRKLYFRGKPAWIPPKPVPMQAPPATPKRLKGIET